MRPEDFDIDQLISDLSGTCSTIEEHLPEGMEEDDLTPEDYSAIDDQIFKCATCSWWCEIQEAVDDHGEDVCQDCSE